MCTDWAVSGDDSLRPCADSTSRAAAPEKNQPQSDRATSEERTACLGRSLQVRHRIARSTERTTRKPAGPGLLWSFGHREGRAGVVQLGIQLVGRQALRKPHRRRGHRARRVVLHRPPDLWGVRLTHVDPATRHNSGCARGYASGLDQDFSDRLGPAHQRA